MAFSPVTVGIEKSQDLSASPLPLWDRGHGFFGSTGAGICLHVDQAGCSSPSFCWWHILYAACILFCRLKLGITFLNVPPKWFSSLRKFQPHQFLGLFYETHIAREGTISITFSRRHPRRSNRAIFVEAWWSNVAKNFSGQKLVALWGPGSAPISAQMGCFSFFFGLFQGQPLKHPEEFKLNLLNLKIDEFAEFLITSCLSFRRDRSWKTE